MKNKNATVPKNPGKADMFAIGIASTLAGSDIFVHAVATHTSIPSTTEHVPANAMVLTPVMFRIQDRPKTIGVIALTACILPIVAASAAGSIATAVSDMKSKYETVIPKHVAMFRALFRFAPKFPKATFVNPAYVATSDSDAVPDSTVTFCASTSILRVSSANASDVNKHAVTKTLPPLANAQGKANPPAPKMDFTVFTMAVPSPVSSTSPPSAVVAAVAEEEKTTSELSFLPLRRVSLLPLHLLFRAT